MTAPVEDKDCTCLHFKDENGLPMVIICKPHLRYIWDLQANGN